MEEHFRPYVIVSNSPIGLRLMLPTWRQWIGVIVWRFLPILILSLLMFLGITAWSSFPMYINAGLILVGLIAIYMFSVKIILGININSTFIEVTTFGIIGNRTSEFYISQAQYIEVKISDYVRGGAVFYKLILKNNTSVQFMHQPTLLAKRKDLEIVADTLHNLTRLEIKIKGRFNGEF